MQYKSLTGKKKFGQLFMNGSYYRGKHISLRVSPASGPKDDNLWAFCVSHKLGKAVVRNRCRRVCKEALRLILPEVQPGCHIALLPQSAFSALRPLERKEALFALLKRAALIQPGGVKNTKDALKSPGSSCERAWVY